MDDVVEYLSPSWPDEPDEESTPEEPEEPVVPELPDVEIPKKSKKTFTSSLCEKSCADKTFDISSSYQTSPNKVFL